MLCKDHLAIMIDHFFDKYLVFHPEQEGFTQSGGFLKASDLDQYNEGIFSFLSSSTISDAYVMLYQKEELDVGLLVWKAKTKADFVKIKDTLTSYFGIYQKTKNISSVYFFDEENLTSIELTSGTLEGDEVMLVYADQLQSAFPSMEKAQYICDVEEDDDPDLQDFIE